MHPVEQVEDYVDTRQIHFEFVSERANEPRAPQGLGCIERLGAAVEPHHASARERCLVLPYCKLALAHATEHAESVAAHQVRGTMGPPPAAGALLRRWSRML